MTDDDLRAALRRAHADDHAPPFETTLAATRAARPNRVAMRVAISGAAIVAALIALVMLWPREQEPTRSDEVGMQTTIGMRTTVDMRTTIGMRTTTLRLPLDSLLTIPDQGLLSAAPDLTRGALP